MIPATVVATALHLPLYALQGGKLVSIGAGSRGKFQKQSGRLFLVEDTSYSGYSIARCRKQLGAACIYSAVYTKDTRHVDCFAVHLQGIHILEWNIFNNSIMAGRAADPRLCGFGIGCDFDGILCNDSTFPHTSENEDQVIEWIRNAKPKYVPRFAELPLVVSMRLEKHREHIQYWLNKWKIRVKRLVLNQASSFEERDRTWNYSYKGHEASRHRCSMFFESSLSQASTIASLGGCPVIVPDCGKVVLP